MSPPGAAQAENVAPGPHWGAIDFPDQNRTLLAGLTVNRFTEFNASRDRFNAINQTAGLNFATVSWTERLRAWPEWAGNLTVGAGPTSESPSRNLQSSFHHATTQGAIPTDQTRTGADFMVGGSVTRWSPLFAPRDTGFVGLGVAAGSLYQEVYGRLGVRHLSLAELAAAMVSGTQPTVLTSLSRYMRLSAMGRYSQLSGGSAYPSAVIAKQSYIGQGSVTFADFGEGAGAPPGWALEVALTYDSGLFARDNAHRIERRFGSLAIHFPYGTFEVWNDWVGSTDSGPTAGFRLMLDVLRLSPHLAGS